MGPGFDQTDETIVYNIYLGLLLLQISWIVLVTDILVCCCYRYLGTSLEEEESVVSIFMQFVPGGSIASILARFGALDEAVFRRYTKQILEGVSYLHKNDVIHRYMSDCIHTCINSTALHRSLPFFNHVFVP